MNADLITHSFELAAARCEDLTPLVSARMSREIPESAALFRKDARLVQGEMLSRAIEAILDFVGDRAYAQHFFASEATTHAGYEVPPAMFVRFFAILAESLREILGDDWTPAIAAAWRDLIIEIETCLAPADAEHSEGVSA